MSAYNRGDLCVEGYLLRILAALCRKHGGELRVSGEEVDRVGEPTALTKEWDSKTQELVLRVESVTFREVFKLTPEKQPVRERVTAPSAPAPNGHAVDPLAGFFREAAPATDPVDKSRSVSTLEGERLVELENKLKKIRLKRMFQEEIEANRRKAAQQERTTP